MQQNIIDFVQCKRIAIVGASRSGKKFGNSVATELVQRGYQVYYVHPNAEQIDGQPCFANLAALQGKAEAVFICLPPHQASAVLRDAATAGYHKVWLQQGSQSLETAQTAQEVGLDPITGKCLLMYAPPVSGVHGFHRFINKLVGQL